VRWFSALCPSRILHDPEGGAHFPQAVDHVLVVRQRVVAVFDVEGIRRHLHTPRVAGTRKPFIRTRTSRAVADRRVFPFLALTTLTVALLAGLVVTIIDKQDFPDYGTAVWWAIVTLGTVGYGDVVPHTGWGRVVGSVVIIVGVTFIAFLTAVVTSLFVEEEQKLHRAESEDTQRAYQDEMRLLLEDVSNRLSTVETLLRDTQGQRR